MIHRFLLHNDSIHEASEKLLSPGQIGLLAGWGVFSTMRVFDGVLFGYERHWARMRKDAGLLRVPFPEDPDRLRELLLKLVAANGVPNCSLRLVVVRNRGGVWEAPGLSREYDVIALTSELKNWSSTVRLGVAVNARHAASPFAGTKVMSWCFNLYWAEEAREKGFDEVVLLNERGEVSECTSANIFACFGDRVVTPPLSSGCLAGVTRELLLDEVRAPGVSVEESVLRLADLEAADGVFITSTTRRLLAVELVDGIRVRRIDSARDRLQQAFNRYVDDYVSRFRLLSPA